MCTRRIFCYFFVLILLTVSTKVDAASTSAANPPAKEPWTTELVDWYPGSGVGTDVSIAHHPTSGMAYISYYDSINGDLWMAHEVTPGTGNCHNNNDWNCHLVDSSGDVGRFSSIDVIYVYNPPVLFYTMVGISYYDATNRQLKYARYKSNAVEPWTIYSVDAPGFSTESRGSYTSLKFNSNHQPVIGYHALNTAGYPYGSVKLATFKGSGGSGCNGGSPTWSCETIDSITDAGNTDHGSFVSIDFAYDGSLSVAFFNSSLKSLDMAQYYGFGGSCSNNEWNCLTIDDGINRGRYVSLHAPNSPTDKIQLAYYDSYYMFGSDLRYAVYVGSGGNCTSTAYDCYSVDHVGTPAGNYGLSMDVDSQGYPIIAYMDASVELAPTQLKIARPALAYGEDWGNCGDVPPGYLFQYWTCKTLDSGSGYTDEASFVAVSVSPAGLATVAYSEYNHHDDETYLKVAQQHFMNYLPLIKK